MVNIISLMVNIISLMVNIISLMVNIIYIYDYFLKENMPMGDKGFYVKSLILIKIRD